MKSLKYLLFLVVFVAAFLMMARSNAALYASIEGENELASMTITVKEAINSKSNAKKIQSQLKKLEGVSKVEVCTESGTVKVSYDKARLGCCSKITGNLQNNGWKFDTVADVKNPNCSKDKATCPGQAGASSGCCQGKTSGGSCQGKAKAN